MLNRKIKVLVVDDSALMRRIISRLLEEEKDFQVIGTAVDGKDALQKIHTLKPDAVTMDVEMPVMDGLTALRRVMRQCPVPVVMLSAYTTEGTRATVESLARGAVDFVPKPTGGIAELSKMVARLAAKLRVAARVSTGKVKVAAKTTVRRETSSSLAKGKTDLVVIGSSTGGPAALQNLIPALPKDFPAGVVLVQHFPEGFSKALAESLRRKSRLPVKHAEQGDCVVRGQVLVAPAGFDLTFHKAGEQVAVSIFKDTKPPPPGGFRPSVDKVMTSAAQVYRDRLVGVLLTGMGKDGALGMVERKKYNGRTIAEDESSCVVFGMPRAAIALGAADKVAPLPKIPAEIIKMA